jgi:hypothetical protein
VVVTGIISPKPQDKMPIRPDNNSITAHGAHSLVEAGSFRVRGSEIARVLVGAKHGLKVVAVQVERVLACVTVVDDHLDDLVFFEHKAGRVGPVHGWVGRQVQVVVACG